MVVIRLDYSTVNVDVYKLTQNLYTKLCELEDVSTRCATTYLIGFCDLEPHSSSAAIAS